MTFRIATLHCLTGYVVLGVSLVLGNAADPVPLPQGAVRADLHSGIDYQPFKVEGARLIPRVQHLQPERDWERMDIYVPETAQPGDELPCIVNVYGGGYGEKGVGTIRGIVQPLIKRGFVVACPDYALQVSSPEALASWDVAAAIRHLRVHAADYQIDPERIGICGWSAGGWIAQFIGYAGPKDFRTFEMPAEKGKGAPGATPVLDPRPLHADHPVTLQAVVSDWGAGKLVSGRGDEAKPHVSLSADDPPLLTCFDGKPRDLPNSSVGFLQALGIAAEPVFLGDIRSTHVPKFDTPGWNVEGEATTWEEAIADFFERTVQNPPRCSAPQLVATQGGRVKLLGVHAIYGDGAVHYTTDGSEPTPKSPRYKKPVELKPGQTIRAISTKPGLPSSPVASYTVPGFRRPVISEGETTFDLRVGQPFRVELNHQLPEDSGVTWAITGRVGEKYRIVKGRPRMIPWLQIDRDSGVLTGVSRTEGVYPVIVSAFVNESSRSKLEVETAAANARLIILTVSE